MASAEPKGASGVFLGKVLIKRTGTVPSKTGTLLRQPTGQTGVAGAERASTKRKAA